MSPEKLFENVSTKNVWLEKSILALNASWEEMDVKLGNYLFNWINNAIKNGKKIGFTLTNDEWRGKARFLAQKYCNVLLKIYLDSCAAKIRNLQKEIDYWDQEFLETHKFTNKEYYETPK